MKNTTKKINCVIAKITLSSARAGAGLSSRWGWFQTKVPKRIAK